MYCLSFVFGTVLPAAVVINIFFVSEDWFIPHWMLVSSLETFGRVRSKQLLATASPKDTKVVIPPHILRLCSCLEYFMTVRVFASELYDFSEFFVDLIISSSPLSHRTGGSSCCLACRPWLFLDRDFSSFDRGTWNQTSRSSSQIRFDISHPPRTSNFNPWAAFIRIPIRQTSFYFESLCNTANCTPLLSFKPRFVDLPIL